MNRRCLKKTARCLSLLGALLLGAWLSSRTLPACLERDHAGSASPKLVLPCNERDLGTVRQGAVFQVKFPVTNAGTRRLVLVERAEACCGQSAGTRQVIVAPGDTTELTLPVDTATWQGRLEHAAQYTTNDPKLPQFALKVTALVESPPL